MLQYIGTLDVPRPSSRVEIVAAMRRIRVRTTYIGNFGGFVLREFLLSSVQQVEGGGAGEEMTEG